ncbi:DUF2971 domain-containing protein [Acinetobacter entericus]|uniref:DUF2971 domain-containing protein n=1 Tax=Acinetobacter entericus TaxID=2989714 RepID=A0ABT3NJN5_9GAMM|nr:DUF2971 domain-containing protein [Acinetobacter entericus]MCW8039770.1 DUF2971 domain-containing protein [Acinetobacter entericus]
MKTLESMELFAPNSNQLTDPCEGVFIDEIVSDKGNSLHPYLREQFKRFYEESENIGIYSLSKTPIDELLWAYYANSHKGFCIEYDLDELLKINDLKTYFDVNYGDINKLNFGSAFVNNSINKLLKLILGNKSNAWIHEDEIRLLTESSGSKKISEDAITGIYFGLRMPECGDKDVVVSQNDVMFALKNKNIKFYKMYLEPDSYQLNFNEIESKY